MISKVVSRGTGQGKLVNHREPINHCDASGLLATSTGASNSRWRAWNKGRKHSDSHRRNLSLSWTPERKEAHSRRFRGVAFSASHKENLSAAHLGKSMPVEVREKIKATMKQRCAHPDERSRLSRICSSKSRNTTPERLFAAHLRLMGVLFEQQFYVEGHPHAYDFFLPEMNLIVEVDGCYWHGCPTHYPLQTKNRATDKSNEEFAVLFGYKLERIWECEILEGVKWPR